MNDSNPAPLPRSNRDRRSVLASSAAPDLSVAALEVLATAHQWWARRAASFGLSDQEQTVEAAISATPQWPHEQAQQVSPREDLVDATPEALADAYVTALDKSVRTADGRHYTPSSLANALYTQAIDALSAHPDGLIWDPAAGAGMLLLPALRAWVADNLEEDPLSAIAHVSHRIAGRDLDAGAVWLGNILLAAELLPLWARVSEKKRRPLPALLEVGDGLSAAPGPVALLLMNPPYGRVRLSEADRSRWSHILFGHANRYSLFMAAGIEALTAGGVMSVLVPAGWLGGSYFQKLRAHLSSNAPLRSITFVSDRAGVFTTGVLQETVLATFRKEAIRETVSCRRITINGKATIHPVSDTEVPPSGSLPWLIPRHEGDVPIVRAARGMKHRLSDYGWCVSTGPLVWNRHKPQLSEHSTPNSVKIVWAADLDGGQLHQDPLRDNLRHLALRDKDHKVLVLDRPAVLVQRTTAPEQPRRLLAAVLDETTLRAWGGRVSVENHVNVLAPTLTPALVGEKPSVLTAELLTALLDSEALDRLYRCLTGSVAVSAYELEALPLPSPEDLEAWAGLSGERLTLAINAVYGLGV